MLRWCPSTYKYIDGALKALPSARKRIPRIDSMHDDQIEKATESFRRDLAAGIAPIDALTRVHARVDAPTFDECVLAAHHRSNMPIPLSLKNQFKLGKRLDLLERQASAARQSQSSPLSGKSPLQVLAAPLPGYNHTNYSRLYDCMSTDERDQFDAEYDAFNTAREPLLESRHAGLSPALASLQHRWQKEIKYTRLAKYPALDLIASRIPALVATEMTRAAGAIASARFPLGLTALCRKVGFALERELLDYARKQLQLPAAYSRSRFLAASLGHARWTGKDLVIVGAAYVEQALLRCKTDQKHPQTGKMVARPAFWKTFHVAGPIRHGIVKLNPALLVQLRSSIEAAELSDPPMVVPPTRWRTLRDGGYLTARGQALFPQSAQTPEQRAQISRAMQNERMNANLDGIDALSQTGWSVNQKVLNVVKQVFATGAAFGDIPQSGHSEKATKYEADREQLEAALNVADKLAAHGHRFYIPLFQDFRGRVYPLSGTKLSYMGSDSMRALFEFWHGKPLGKTGLEALYVHLAGVYGRSTGLSKRDRVAWVDSQLEHIKAAARDPLASAWWKQASKPFQTLAACFEIAEALENPESFVSHLPIAQDGTCNGLQHYAALARSTKAAAAVNLTYGDAPSDLYTTVGQGIDSKLDRSIVKRAVMAAVYGRGSSGVVDELALALNTSGVELEKARTQARKLGPQVLSELGKLVPVEAVPQWLNRNAKRILSSRRADIPEKTTTIKWTSPLGLPVVQPYGQPELFSVRTPLQSFYLQSPYHLATTDSLKQVRALPANYVHSMDAAHLLLTAQAAAQASICMAAVHDSFWTHAADARDLAQIIRDQFVTLYTSNPLEALKQEWERTYSGHMVLCDVHSSSPAYDALRQLRNKKRANFEAELVEEYNALVSGTRTAASAILDGEPVDWSGSTPRIGEPHMPKIKAWIPLKIDSPPQGDFDLAKVREAEYFFN